MSLPVEAYLWFKTLHIIGVVVWFAGLFYLVRLFIYHVEAKNLAKELQKPFFDQYSLNLLWLVGQHFLNLAWLSQTCWTLNPPLVSKLLALLSEMGSKTCAHQSAYGPFDDSESFRSTDEFGI